MGSTPSRAYAALNVDCPWRMRYTTFVSHRRDASTGPRDDDDQVASSSRRRRATRYATNAAAPTPHRAATATATLPRVSSAGRTRPPEDDAEASEEDEARADAILARVRTAWRVRSDALCALEDEGFPARASEPRGARSSAAERPSAARGTPDPRERARRAPRTVPRAREVRARGEAAALSERIASCHALQPPSRRATKC